MSTPCEAPCPACGAPSTGTRHTENGVVYANLLCAAGHLWAAHWFETTTGDAA